MECTLEAVSLARQNGSIKKTVCGDRVPFDSILPDNIILVKYTKWVAFSRKHLNAL